MVHAAPACAPCCCIVVARHTLGSVSSRLQGCRSSDRWLTFRIWSWGNLTTSQPRAPELQALPRRPLHASPPEQVQVDVEDGLTGVAVGVEHRSVAAG